MVEDRYEQLHAAFRWQVPPDFNIAEACCGRWARATPKATAIYFDSESGCRAQYSYAQLQRAANRLSNALLNQGVRRGHRVAIVLPQRFETAVAHIALQQIGAVAMPLSMLFGAEALAYRLQDSGAVLAIAACEVLPALREVKSQCPALRRVLVVGDCPAEGDELHWMEALQAEEARFKPVATRADDPAILIYTSGTIGNPKGALIPQRALIGNLTGFIASQNWFGFDPFDASRPSDAVFWSPADWAWTGGLMDALLPTLYFGRPIVAWQGRFSAAKAFELMATYGVTHSFLFPTALKAMMKAEPRPRRHGLKLRALMSAGEAVGDAVFAWCRDALGVPVNEMFGQTEMNYVVGNCQALWPAKPGSMGRAYPGHRVAVIDDEGRACAPGRVGEVAVHARDRHGALTLSSSSATGTTTPPPAPSSRVTQPTVGAALATSRAWTPMARSGTRAGPMTSSRARATASGRARSRTACSSTPPSPTPPWCPSPTPSGARWSRPMWCWPTGTRATPRWWRPCRRT